MVLLTVSETLPARKKSLQGGGPHLSSSRLEEWKRSKCKRLSIDESRRYSNFLGYQ
jgi:hypothetical protein